MEKEKIKKQIIQMLNKMNKQQLNEIFKITHHFFCKGALMLLFYI